jgi:hypothetical protein
VCLRAVSGHGCALSPIGISLSREGEAVLVESVEEIKDGFHSGKRLSR